MIVKNRVDYYLLHTSVCANMEIRSAHQHEIALSQNFINFVIYFIWFYWYLSL